MNEPANRAAHVLRFGDLALDLLPIAMRHESAIRPFTQYLFAHERKSRAHALEIRPSLIGADEEAKGIGSILDRENRS